ncbi:conserved domain protein [Actinomyces sp. oral taxon 170 str. F0386]|nr:conserved domain protein [Actinomyces sp. oral taxon 170 str. F0386]
MTCLSDSMRTVPDALAGGWAPRSRGTLVPLLQCRGRRRREHARRAVVGSCTGGTGQAR